MPRVTFILVRPQHPGNIGAAARVMANFGIVQLRLVSPRVSATDPIAVQRALYGASILRESIAYVSVQDALADVHLAIATSRRPGRQRPQFHRVEHVTTLTHDMADEQRMAILFGSEEHGLHNDEIASCQEVVTIASTDAAPSLNLAQAVGIVAYELSKGNPVLPAEPTRPMADGQSLEELYAHLEEAFAQINLFPHGNNDHVMRHFRHLFGRARLTEQEVAVLRGLAQQILWAQRQKGRSSPETGCK
jgi:tRNA/rRNA methyltransferase